MRAAVLSVVITQFVLSVRVAAVVVGRHPPALEDAIDEHVCVLRVNLPEASFAWLVFLPGHLLEALVERQVVAN